MVSTFGSRLHTDGLVSANARVDGAACGYTGTVRHRIPSVDDLKGYTPQYAATRLLTREFRERRVVVPVSVVGGSLVVAVTDPDRLAATIAEVALLTGMKVDVVLATAADIKDTIAVCYANRRKNADVSRSTLIFEARLTPA